MIWNWAFFILWDLFEILLLAFSIKTSWCVYSTASTLSTAFSACFNFFVFAIFLILFSFDRLSRFWVPVFPVCKPSIPLWNPSSKFIWALSSLFSICCNWFRRKISFAWENGICASAVQSCKFYAVCVTLFWSSQIISHRCERSSSIPMDHFFLRDISSFDWRL